MHRMHSLESATLARLQVSAGAQLSYPFTASPMPPPAAHSVSGHPSPSQGKRVFAKRSKTKARQATAHKTRVPQDLPTPRHAGAAGATPIRRVHVVPPAFPVVPAFPSRRHGLTPTTPASTSSSTPLTTTAQGCSSAKSCFLPFSAAYLWFRMLTGQGFRRWPHRHRRMCTL